MQPKTLIEHKVQEIRYRDRIIVVLITLLFLMTFAYLRFPSIIDIHRIPDPGRLLSHNAKEVPKTHAHSFARLAIETIMHCGKDCKNDIPNNIDALHSYVTDSCRNQMKVHVEKNPNLFTGRTRQIKYVYDKTPANTQFTGDNPLGTSETSVSVIDDGTWHVELKYNLLENVAGYETINRQVIYPIRIIKSTLPKIVNEYQLRFDCFYGHIEHLEKANDK